MTDKLPSAWFPLALFLGLIAVAVVLDLVLWMVNL